MTWLAHLWDLLLLAVLVLRVQDAGRAVVWAVTSRGW